MQLTPSSDNGIHYTFLALIDKASVHLCDWLEKSLFRFAGQNWWSRNVCGVLNDDEVQKIKNSGSIKLQDFDVHLLLKVLERNYNFLKGRLHLPPEGRDLIYEFRQIRNRCVGHRPIRGNDVAQLMSDIQTLEDFCSAILNAPALVKEFRNLREGNIAPIEVASSSIDTQPVVSLQAGTPHVSPFLETTGQPLASMFTGYELSASQQSAISSLEAFFKDDSQRCFVLKGYAGTGKTFLIGGIVRFLEAHNKTPVLMAPTGRAAHVMKERHKIDANTIHRHIYGWNKLQEFKEIGENGSITYKFYFGLKNNDTHHDTVFIVDEASMLSDVYTEAEFMRFGSGRLLRDLLEYINFDGNDHRKKIIFVGDGAQLPPVDMNFSPALDEKHLEKYTRSHVSSVELTDVMRQKEGDLILQNATAMRRMLSSNDFASFDFQSDNATVSEETPDHFMPHYLKHIDQFGVSSSVIIGYSNVLVNEFNKVVRAHLFPKGRQLEPQDRIMVVKNNYRHAIELFNGQTGTVLEIVEPGETHTVHLNVGLDDAGNRKNVQIELHFRKALLCFEGMDGKSHNISCLYIEDLLNSPHRELSSEQSKALYVDFCNRNPHLKSHSQEFKEALLSDPYFNALQLKYAYAVTCHKAQGGEWPTVYVDFQSQNKLDPMAIRWSYTALTRAARKVVATNALHHHLLTPLKQKKPVAVVTQPQPAVATAVQSLLITPLPNFVVTASLIDQQIYTRLAGLLPEGFEINNLTARLYLSQWAVSRDTCSCLVKIHYNGKNKISDVRVESASPGEWINPLQAAVSQLKNVQLALIPALGQQVTPVVDEKIPHGSFFVELNARCISQNIRVLTVEHLTTFHSRCKLETEGDVFDVNYHFNAKQQFTSYIPENGLPDRLLEIIANVHFGQHQAVE